MPTKPTKKPRKVPASKYREQYGVIVLCDDEKHQKAIYDNLALQGLKLKVVVT